ncbi:hypothetical protein ACFSSC_07020 [Corynebacterium mendelii]|uniref:Secreted protein n=1 Tax=Corynebacterium mendelii TaxID=2765362 RepID=A0A939IYA4_9CORY|nr:hypothetical protein [Corynebacterium mendelii]MBN9644918.1 hypothetical protein [Corynebacterium mendelii]
MTSSRFTKALISSAVAASLIAGTGVAAAEDNEKGGKTEAVVTLERDGSSGFDFNSSGTGPKGKAHNAKVDSSKGNFTSSNATGDQAKQEQQNNNTTTKSESSSDNPTVKAVMIIAGVLAVFAAGYTIAVQHSLLPR